MSTQKSSRSLLSLFALPVFAALALLPVLPVEGVTFQPKGKPQQTVGGASRGICLPGSTASNALQTSNSGIVALIPATDQELTVAAYPTVLVQVPESNALAAEFSLWDGNSKGIYQTTINLTGTPGIVGFQLPTEAGPLEIGKQYKWTVAIICDPAQRQRDIVLEGWLQRSEIHATLSHQLASADPLQKAKLYAQNGFWYDTVTTLAELKQLRPEDTTITTEWQQLLQSVGLTESKELPIINCCQAQK